jgi:AcrR family transcriptional regulator
VPKILSPTQIEAFRQRLIDAAERQFARAGPEAVSLRHLAAELGVSAMTPYRYFKDKDAILAAVRARGFDRFADALENAAAAETDLSAASRAVGEAYVRFALEHPAAYRVMFDLTQPDDSAYPDLTRATERARATLTAHVRPLIEAGLIQGDLQTVAHAFWAALHGLIVLRMSEKLSPEADFDAILTTMMGALYRGLGAGTVA